MTGRNLEMMSCWNHWARSLILTLLTTTNGNAKRLLAVLHLPRKVSIPITVSAFLHWNWEKSSRNFPVGKPYSINHIIMCLSVIFKSESLNVRKMFQTLWLLVLPQKVLSSPSAPSPSYWSSPWYFLFRSHRGRGGYKMLSPTKNLSFPLPYLTSLICLPAALLSPFHKFCSLFFC